MLVKFFIDPSNRVGCRELRINVSSQSDDFGHENQCPGIQISGLVAACPLAVTVVAAVLVVVAGVTDETAVAVRHLACNISVGEVIACAEQILL